LTFVHSSDGNGRTGRLWQSLILQKWKKFFAWLPIETLIYEKQEDYYTVLNASNTDGESTKFVAFMLKVIRDALQDVINRQKIIQDDGANVGTRAWYEKEAQEQAWSYRTLQRNISSQYYYRLLMSQNTEPVEAEMKELTSSYQADKLEFIKNPVIAEFLGLESNTDFTETELEQCIITHIQKFLMEKGKGYAPFVAR
jgi:predicted nuclease of restriction endonuclease-like (RecB) superfamily